MTTSDAFDWSRFINEQVEGAKKAAEGSKPKPSLLDVANGDAPMPEDEEAILELNKAYLDAHPNLAKATQHFNECRLTGEEYAMFTTALLVNQIKIFYDAGRADLTMPLTMAGEFLIKVAQLYREEGV